MTKESATRESVEILSSLKKLNEPLSETELEFLQTSMSHSQSTGDSASNDSIATSSQDSLLSMAKANIQNATRHN